MNKDPFRYYITSPEFIQLAVIMYVRFPLSFRNVEDLLHERGIDIYHESVRKWVSRFGPMFAEKIRTKRASFTRQQVLSAESGLRSVILCPSLMPWHCQTKLA